MPHNPWLYLLLLFGLAYGIGFVLTRPLDAPLDASIDTAYVIKRDAAGQARSDAERNR